MSFLNNQRIKEGGDGGSRDMAAIRGVGYVRSSAGKKRTGSVPERNYDELRVLGSILDVVRDDRHVPEIQRGVDLVHEIQWGGLSEEFQPENIYKPS